LVNILYNMYTVQYEWNFNVTLFSEKGCSP
jgi:hypothetical protein